MSSATKVVEYHVTYMIGERVSEAVMTQRELDECRASCEIIEALPIGACRRSVYSGNAISSNGES